MHKPLKQCKQPGCPALVPSGYCEKHKSSERAPWRAVAMKWYKSKKWQLVKNAFRAKPCVGCGVTSIGVVDHIRPHRGDARLFWDPFNWQKMCIPCHNTKSATE